jgi:hypothetical protein
MTTPEPQDPEAQDDAALDRRIRAASAVPFDDIAVTEAVLARTRKTRAARPAPPRTGRLGWIGPAAFASILVATPFVVALYPASDDAVLVGLATGDPHVILAGTEVGFEGAFE